MNIKIILLMTIVIVVADGGKGGPMDEARGLKSISAFCEGKGRLDDLRDIVQEVYLLRSRRSSTVSYFCYIRNLLKNWPKLEPKKLIKMLTITFVLK